MPIDEPPAPGEARAADAVGERANKLDSAGLADLYLKDLMFRAMRLFELMGIPRGDWEDLSQDCFLALSQFRLRVENPAAYFLTAARSRGIDQMRAAHHRQTRPLEAAENFVGESPDPLTAVAARQFLAALPEDDRRLIWERLYEGKDHREIAAELGILPGSTRTKLLRAMNYLRRLAGVT